MSSVTSTSMVQKEGRGRPKPPSSNSSTTSASNATPPPGIPTQAAKKHPKFKTHNRSLSHNKLVSKLASPSGSSLHLARPGLNRSKSTDGLIKNRPNTSLKRNNRSVTKLTGLHPLKPTLSNTSIKLNKSTSSLKGLNSSSGQLVHLSGLKSSGRKGKAILRLNEDDNEDYEDLDNEESEAPLEANSEPGYEIEHSQLENKGNYLEQSNDLMNDFQRQSKPNSLPDQKTADEIKQDIENGSFKPLANKDGTEGFHDKENPLYESSERNFDSQPPNSQKGQHIVDSESERSQRSELYDDSESSQEKDNNFNNRMNSKHTVSNRSSTDDFSNNMYGGSLLLSQSTGLTKKIDNRVGNQVMHQKLLGSDAYTTNGSKSTSNTSIPKNQSFVDSNNFEPNSGISFRANPIENIAEPVITNKNVIQNNSYQPNQTIFNNLQRTNSQYLLSKKQTPGTHHVQSQQPQAQLPQNHNAQKNKSEHAYDHTIQNGVNNFSNFLANNNNSDQASSSHNMETRAQQRLWLQRENSLLDISNLDASNLANFSNLSLNNLMFANNYNNSAANPSPINLRDQHQHNQQQPMFPLTPGGLNLPGRTGAAMNGEVRGMIDAGQGFNLGQIPQTHTSQSNASSQGISSQSENHSSSMTNINGLLLMAQNSHQNSIQSRTEFERLNREYLNVRRHLNPAAESLSRVEKYAHGGAGLSVSKNKKKRTESGSTNSDSIISGTSNGTFREISNIYSEKEQELNMTLNRLWQDAVMSSKSSASPSPSPSGPSGQAGQSQGLMNQALQMQRPGAQRVSSFSNQTSMGGSRSHAPTTRAVKLAAQAAASGSQKKRGDTNLTLS